ncbi:hypothetical protein Dimus_036856 [Dionaea muscipula]
MPSVLHKNNKYKNYVFEIEESKKKDEERDQEIANLKILVAQLMNGGGGNNHSSCNTWVLLVLNWKLGAGTSLAYLTDRQWTHCWQFGFLKSRPITFILDF